MKSLVHASEILWAFQHPGEGLRLRDVMDRTGFGKGMCFRLLYTLRHCGFIEKVDGNRYRLTSEIRRRKRYRIGYASQGQDSSFATKCIAGSCGPPSANASSSSSSTIATSRRSRSRTRSC